MLLSVITLSKGINVKPWLKQDMGEALMFESLEIFRMAGAMARHAGHKQAVVAQNVANADTPGYIARDLPDFKTTYQPDNSATSGPKATRLTHLHGVAAQGAPLSAVEVRDQASPNGNEVSIEGEMLKSVDAKRQHDRAMAIYKSALGMLRSSIRSN